MSAATASEREDRLGREAAQTLFDRPLVLEAGAGTGKTTTLAARILSWCLGPGWLEVEDPETAAGDPDAVAARVLEGVVAITFTEAAAAEMAGRVAEGLARVAGGEAGSIPGFEPGRIPGRPPEEEMQRRAYHLVGALDHLTARTIHAWCRSLLARYPIEAGLHPDLQVDADGGVVDEVVREVVERRVRTAYAREPGGPLARLAARRLGPRDVAAVLRDLAIAAIPAESMARDPFEAPAVEALLGRLAEPLARLLAAGEGLSALPERQLGRRLALAARDLAAALAELPAAPLERTAHAAAAVRRHLGARNLRQRLGDWARGKLLDSEERALGDAAGEAVAAAGALEPILAHFERLDPPTLDLARRALAPLLAEVRSRLRARGAITFQGLLDEARRLLAADAAVRRAERARIRQLLVDEFQDTDGSQCDLVRALALGGADGRRPGLLLVGDPKQSIYAWRDADLEAYEALVDEALALGGRRFVLSRNFRSAPPILAEVERAVAPVMERQPGLQPPFQPLLESDRTAGRPGFARLARAPVEHWLAPAAGATNDEVGRLAARAIARDMRELYDGGCAWRSFALLLRSSGRLETFLEALREEGVPFQVTRDKQFYRRREILDAAALVRAVVHPADHLALLTWLRSPSVGVPDAALLPLWSRGFPRQVTELDRPRPAALETLRRLVAEAAAAMPADVPGLERVAGWERSLADALDTLAGLRSSFRDEPADRFLERLRRATLIEVTEGARYLGAFRLANLERLFRDLGGDLEDSGGDVEAILRTLRQRVREVPETEQALPKDVAEDAVQVTTIHAAKGLEFDHVYLPELHVRSGGDERRALDLDERRKPGRPLEYVLFGAPTPGFHEVRALRRRIEAAERVRTLYVALTRARERLVLVGRWPAEPRPRPAAASRTFADLLASRRDLPQPFAELGERLVGSESPIDAGGARWRRLAAVPERPPAEAQIRPELAPSAAVAAEAEALSGLRAKAAERRDRPWSAAAAAEADERLTGLLELEDGGGGSRSAALAAGTAIHEALESWDFAADPEAELERGRRRLGQRLAGLLPPDEVDAARRRAEELLDRFRAGPLWRRFLDLGPAVVGREVPLLLPPGGGDGAVGFVSGAIDLLYRDSGTGEWVIADYKTDRVEPGEAIDRRVEAYSAQEEVYRRAVEEHLEPGRPVRLELWFLWPGEVRRIGAG